MHRFPNLLLTVILLLLPIQLLASPFVPSGQPATNLTASIVTFQPGSLYWQRFGHNALVLREASTGVAVTFNYGLFDFTSENFFLNFARGHMVYLVAPNRLENDLIGYREDRRWAVEQRLNLDPKQIGRLRDFLAWNVLPENAEYRYDYFLSNCSTRLRDALDYALDGGLKAQLQGRMTSATFRSESTRLISPDSLLMAGMDLMLGPTADKPLDLWQQSFAPLALMHALRTTTVRVADGRELSLVGSEVRLLNGGRKDPPAVAPDLRLQFLLAGVLLAAILLGLARLRALTTARWLFMLIAVSYVLLCGLAGMILAALWGLTEHWAGWRNESLLLVNPLCLLLVPALVMYPRLRWRPSRFTRSVAQLIVLTALVALVIRELPGLAQSNLHWALLVLPVHAALAFTLARAKQPDGEL